MTKLNSKLSLSNLASKIKIFLSGRTFSFGIGYVSFLGGRLLRDLLLARFLGAGAFGSWAALNILRQYGNYSDVGLLNGLARELPRLKNQPEQASEMAGQAVIGTIVGTLLILLWVLVIEPEGFSKENLGWTSVVLMSFFICIEKVYKYFNSILLGMDHVKSAGLWLACLSILDLILAASGAYWGGISGLLLGTVTAISVTSIAMYFFRPIKLIFKFSFGKFKFLFLSSLLLMSFGLLNIALHNFDRTVFLFLNGPDEVLGSYHAASLLALSVSIVPFIITSVANPRIYSLNAEADVELNDLLSSSGLLACILAAMGGIFAFVLSPMLLSHFFPLQTHASQIAPYLILGEIFFAAAMIPDSILLVKGKGTRVLIFKAVTMLALMSVAILTQKYNPSPSADLLAVLLAQFMTATQVGCFLVSFIMCLKSMKISKTNFKIFIWPLVLSSTTFIIVYFAEYRVLWKS